MFHKRRMADINATVRQSIGVDELNLILMNKEINRIQKKREIVGYTIIGLIIVIALIISIVGG